MSGTRRREQLLGLAREVVRGEGADALTLARLAARAGVSKPVVYSHFASRTALLLSLYEDFNARQTAALRQALTAAEPGLPARTAAVSTAHLDCHLLEGAELPGVVDALTGDPQLEAVRRRAERDYLDECRAALAEAGGADLTEAGAIAFLGAAEALSRGVLNGSLTRQEAGATLRTVLSTVVASA